MNTIQEFVDFINQLENSNVRLDSVRPESAELYHTINLKVLTKDIKDFESFQTWWKSKNLPDHLHKTLVKTLLKINPPDNVKNELLAMMI